PAGAFYLLCRAPGGDAKVFSEEAKSREGILVVPCDGFGLPGYVRIAYCVAPSVIDRSLSGFERLAALYRLHGTSGK
ncbi:MAG: pyridoxal phosphate-dependent aminotransferase, partial [Eubacteriales bacterium]